LELEFKFEFEFEFPWPSFRGKTPELELWSSCEEKIDSEWKEGKGAEVVECSFFFFFFFFFLFLRGILATSTSTSTSTTTTTTTTQKSTINFLPPLDPPPSNLPNPLPPDAINRPKEIQLHPQPPQNLHQPFRNLPRNNR